ncbi:hypothetical protein BDU57DRAFT_513026 [Ampelomyces quisqualis]|uniref:Uncharacterized protein n=1 Tax=Ampelomyces quisqualis TaxID=50730 RepID=A0A6A5R0Y8_AMPQU|nr:hypothetical protein BDU57DRAFT_513026 [Ampelomyces quisqualis]
MSWSGPVNGTAPYQPHPYANGLPGYGASHTHLPAQHQAYGQYPPGPSYNAPGPPQRPPNSQPPKKKGNPIITRYPPPPGYRGPVQPQGPFNTNQYSTQYQPPQPPFAPTTSAPAYPSQGYAVPQAGHGYPLQGYGPSNAPGLPQQPHPAIQNYQWPQQGYHQNQPQSQAPIYPSYPVRSASIDPASRSFAHSSCWPQQHAPSQSYSNYNGPSQSTPQVFDPNATPTPTTAHMAAGQASQATSQSSSAVELSATSEKSQLYLAWDDWDFDFEGAIWPKSNEPVDPNLSLGVIIWHPAKQVTRALPSTFDAAEEQALRPAPEGLDNGESVSMYFTTENSHEAFLDVRQTDEWETIRDDPIFVVFNDKDMRQNLVSLEDCIAQRDRPDALFQSAQNDNDEEMPDASWSVMDHLEQVLCSTRGAPQTKGIRLKETHTDVSQEDVLARLGVTGAPKPPSHDPLPPSLLRLEQSQVSLPEKPAAQAFLPSSSHPTPQKAHSYGGHKAKDGSCVDLRTYGSTSSGNGHRYPIPPPPPEPQRQGSWGRPQYNDQSYDGSRGSPALSDGSNHTMAGSDFGPEKPESITAKDDSAIPTLTRSDSSFARKRSYEDADHDNEQPRQHNDYTKRKRRSQVDAVYSRR